MGARGITGDANSGLFLAFPLSAAAANTYRRVGIAGETLPRAVSRRPHARGFTTAMSDSGSEDARDLDLVGEEGDFADWEEEHEEARPTRCLFSSETHPSPDAALRHAAQAFGFDLRALYRQHDMDFYAAMQCLNFARACAQEHASDPAAAAAAAVAGIARGAHRDEKYLSPALEDDPVLFDWEDFVGVGMDADALEDDQAAEQAAKRAQEGGGSEDDASVTARLRAEVETLRLRVLEMSQRLGETPEDEMDDAPANVGALALGLGASSADAPEKGGAVFQKAPLRPRGADEPKPTVKSASQAVDENYFGSYSYFDIHRVMLDDVARTAAYRVALEQNPSCVKGKRVLDIGCGTGILSMFAARGGAAKVVGVDGAADIAAVARANAEHNGFRDVITVVQGKVEELLKEAKTRGDEDGDDVNDENVLRKHSFDVLVSEWMGYALLFESMFDTVIEARDFLLKPGGAILPDVATLHVAGFGRNATSLPFWDDVYGFEMPCVQKSLSEDAVKTAIVAPVKGAHVVTDSAEIKRLDLASVTAKELDFTAQEVVLAARTDGVRGDEVDASVTAGAGEGATGLTQRSVVVDVDAGGPVTVHGVVLWFDTLFSERFSAETPGVLSTSPHERQTHWAQTMLHFPEPISLCVPGSKTAEAHETSGALGVSSNPCASIKVRVGMAKCAEEERVRGLDVSLEYVCVGAGGEEGERKARMYRV